MSQEPRTRGATAAEAVVPASVHDERCAKILGPGEVDPARALPPARRIDEVVACERVASIRRRSALFGNATAVTDRQRRLGPM